MLSRISQNFTYYTLHVPHYAPIIGKKTFYFMNVLLKYFQSTLTDLAIWFDIYQSDLPDAFQYISNILNACVLSS